MFFSCYIRYCVELSDLRNRYCLSEISVRNSQSTYPLTVISEDDFDSTFNFLVIALQSQIQIPSECLDAAIHVLCLILAPPCDPVTDLRLPICARSCEAVTRLRLEGSCTEVDQFLIGLAQNPQENVNAWRTYRDRFLAFDCRNISTYDFFNGTLDYSQDGQCTSIISTDAEGQSSIY